MGRHIFSLEDKCVVVFGGAGYLGHATVEAMLELGARVLVADLFPDHSADQVARLRGHEGCVLQPCDISDSGQIRAALQCCEEAFAAVNAVVNFAVYAAPVPEGRSSLEATSDEDFDYSLRGVLGSAYRVVREAIPYLRRHAPASIVNTASMYGLVSPDGSIYGDSGQNNPVYYGAGKAGVLQLSRYAAAELAAAGIRVNCVTPGPFPDSRKRPPADFLARLAGKTMLGRVGSCADIAGAYCYLISDAAAFTTGANLVVDGGWTAW